jgi:hypothetical protein
MSKRRPKKKQEAAEIVLARQLQEATIRAYVKHNEHHNDPRWRNAPTELEVLILIARELIQCQQQPSASTPTSKKRPGRSRSAASSTLTKLPGKHKDLPGQQLFPLVETILATENGPSD